MTTIISIGFNKILTYISRITTDAFHWRPSEKDMFNSFSHAHTLARQSKY